MTIDELGTRVRQLLAQVVCHGNEQQRLEDEVAQIEKEFDELREQCKAPKEVEKYKKALMLACQMLDDQAECCPAEYLKLDLDSNCKIKDCDIGFYSGCWSDYFLKKAEEEGSERDACS